RRPRAPACVPGPPQRRAQAAAQAWSAPSASSPRPTSGRVLGKKRARARSPERQRPRGMLARARLQKPYLARVGGRGPGRLASQAVVINLSRRNTSIPLLDLIATPNPSLTGSTCATLGVLAGTRATPFLDDRASLSKAEGAAQRLQIEQQGLAAHADEIEGAGKRQADGAKDRPAHAAGHWAPRGVLHE